MALKTLPRFFFCVNREDSFWVDKCHIAVIRLIADRIFMSMTLSSNSGSPFSSSESEGWFLVALFAHFLIFRFSCFIYYIFWVYFITCMATISFFLVLFKAYSQRTESTRSRNASPSQLMNLNLCRPEWWFSWKQLQQEIYKMSLWWAWWSWPINLIGHLRVLCWRLAFFFSSPFLNKSFVPLLLKSIHYQVIFFQGYQNVSCYLINDVVTAKHAIIF